jgi:2,4-dienoyl-CoA reductase-like NADH-dependent reductase (Old Yellow Enzyme family)
MTEPRFPKVAALKTAAQFRAHVEGEGIALAFDETLSAPAESPLAQSLTVEGARIGNRFCVLPMEGWDGTPDGRPSELTTRRWRNFGLSGAKLIWGGEAVAVSPEGRANPNQLFLDDSTKPSLAELRLALIAQHEQTFGTGATDDLYVGLQLTHSGRYARPRSKTQAEPLAAYAHPVLDKRFPGGVPVLSDADLDRLVEQFVRAARAARDIGFQFVDVKHCHGYLLHELLSARERPGKYGGSLENRARFLHDVIAGIRADAPGLEIGVRLSVFDSVPFRKGSNGRGEPEVPSPGYQHAFGLLQNDDVAAALDDARALLELLEKANVRLVCTTAGSPYYCPHLQRPAAFPPSDGYEPPEDPLRGVARQIEATAILKSEFPGLVFVGSGYTYLQEWLPHVAQFTVRTGATDFVGLGRAMLSYPELPADVLAGRPLRRKSVCRTFSDCTTGPRLGLVSGCYPLDPFYVAHPDAVRLRAFKAEAGA